VTWNQRHLMIVLREYEDFYDTHRPHRTFGQAAPLHPLPRQRFRPGSVPGSAACSKITLSDGIGRAFPYTAW